MKLNVIEFVYSCIETDWRPHKLQYFVFLFYFLLFACIFLFFLPKRWNKDVYIISVVLWRHPAVNFESSHVRIMRTYAYFMVAVINIIFIMILHALSHNDIYSFRRVNWLLTQCFKLLFIHLYLLCLISVFMTDILFHFIFPFRAHEGCCLYSTKFKL